jgi:hypothetical protein
VATTTPQAIRENQRDLILAITPSEITGYPFVEHVEKGVFAEWVNLNAATCLRAFAIEDLSPYASPESGDYESEDVTSLFAVSVAYPVSYTYGVDGVSGLADVVEQDRLAIERAIGIYAGADYIAGQNASSLAGFEIQRGDKAWIATATYDIRFSRAVSV